MTDTSAPQRKARQWLLVALAVVAIIAASVFMIVITQETPTPQLTRLFDDSPTGVSFRYPDDWTYTIPIPGFMLVGLPQTLFDNQPGPTFTVYRTQPLSLYEGSLQFALDEYLRRGPLQEGREWAAVSEATPATFLERDALVIDLEGRENEASPQQRAHILITTAQNTFVYIFVLTAPLTVWDEFEPTLRAMLDTVQILE